MKHIIIILSVSALLIQGCTFEKEDKGTKGLVQFQQNPTYSNNQIKFKVSVQFSAASPKGTKVDFKVFDGTTMIASGTTDANINMDSGLNIFFYSPEVTVTVNGAGLSGKTILVHLDPDNKVTAKEFTSETYVNLYKKATVTIP